MPKIAMITGIAAAVLPLYISSSVPPATTIDAAKLCGQLREAPSNKLSAIQKDGTILLAQQYDGEDPHGPDPHGPDPRDEVHDPNTEANKRQAERYPTRDVYGGHVPNTRTPY